MGLAVLPGDASLVKWLICLLALAEGPRHKGCLLALAEGPRDASLHLPLALT